jgi:hypothetical protein
MKRWIKGFTGFKYADNQMQEFTHGRTDRLFFGEAIFQHTLVKAFDHRMVLTRDDRWEIQPFA